MQLVKNNTIYIIKVKETQILILYKLCSFNLFISSISKAGNNHKIVTKSNEIILVNWRNYEIIHKIITHKWSMAIEI